MIHVTIVVLASGSKGNATYIDIGGRKLLVDAGISYRQLNLRLAKKTKNLDNLDYVFLTHEHSDHVRALPMVLKHHPNVKIIMTKGTHQGLPRAVHARLDDDNVVLVDFSMPMLFDTFAAEAFMTHHDAIEPCGYRFTEKDKSLVYLTDSGYYPDKEIERIKDADAYIIEANHDPDLLLDSARPWMLKRRILDDQGHLSNQDSAYLLSRLVGERTKYIILAHLSEECNTESAALRAYEDVFGKTGHDITEFVLSCARQHIESEEIIL